MKKILLVLSLGVIVGLASVSAYFYYQINNVNNLFYANVEVLASSEAIEVSNCYVDAWKGPYEYAFFCSRLTNETQIYSCSDASWMHGCLTEKSKCYR